MQQTRSQTRVVASASGRLSIRAVLIAVGVAALACQPREPGQTDTSSATTGSEDGSANESSGSESVDTGDSMCPDGDVYEGDLVITDDTTEADVECIREVTGSLRAEDTAELAGLALLGGLRVVRGDVWIAQNSALADVEGLDGLAEIRGSLYVEQNPVLVSLAGISGLSRIGGMGIAGNPMLHQLPTLTGPIEIVNGEDAGVQVALRFTLNDTLVDFDAFAGAVPTGPGGVRVSISDHAKLSSLAGLSSFAALGSALDLKVAAQGPSLGGLPVLVELPTLDAEVGAVVLKDLPAVSSLEPFADLMHAESVWLQGLGVTDLHGLDGLETVTGDLWIGDCGPSSEPLTSLAGLGSLTTLRALYLVGNSDLSDISALVPTEVTTSLWITDNPSLSTADAQALADAHPDADATVCGNQGEPLCEQCPPQGE